jgi:hypothetical protein
MLRAKDADKELALGLMGLLTTESGKKDLDTVKESLFQEKKPLMMECGKMTSEKDQDKLPMLVETLSKEPGKKID